MWLMALAACTGTDTGPETPPPEGSEVLQLTTRDGVDLVADLYPGASGGAGVVLLHMNPVGDWDRGDWPGSFIGKLTAAGHWVLALDRRGAGESGGVPEEAFEGEAGRYDVEAAVLALDGRGVGSIGVVGASNGTTSALDYAVWAEGEGLPVPSALGFMTGGGYTENQTAMTALGAVPAVFTYSTAERQWSVAQQGLDPGSWEFHEYSDGDHGTRMFSAAPEVEEALEFFLTEAL